jgi:hypothetical protein
VIVGDIEYVTAQDGADRLGSDINPGMIYQWHSRHMVTGYKVGKIVWFRWDELQEVEYVTRTTRAGRPRRET